MMAEGIRVRHHTRRNQIVAVPFLNWALKQDAWKPCKFCNETHLCKVMHIMVDAQGAAIISKPLWRDMQRHVPKAGGFSVANPVKQPPVQFFKPELVKHHVRSFDFVDGINPVHTVDIDTVVDRLMQAVPDATESDVLKFLLAKVLEEGPQTRER